MIDGEKLGLRLSPEANAAHTDEAQVTALVEWFEANPDAIPLVDGESEAQRAIRGLEDSVVMLDTLKIIHEALSYVLDVPRGLSMESLLGAVVGEHAALRAGLIEAVEHMGKSGHPSRVHGMVAGWRDALYRPWEQLPTRRGSAASVVVRIVADDDARTFTLQVLGDES